MSLIRQVWMLVITLVLAACAASVIVSVGSARVYLENQLALKNSDNAQSLALTLTQQAGDESLIELALAAQFDTGHYRSIRLRGPDGRVRMERQAGDVAIPVPAWFVALAPIESRAGTAQVSSGWQALGTVELISQPVFAYADLWNGTVRTTLWMALLAVLALLVSTVAVRRLRQPLDAVVEQAQALTQSRFIKLAEPRTPELRRVTQAMNAMVERVHRQFLEQAEQLESLRQQAQCDPLTGVSHRLHFLARFESMLSAEDGMVQGRLMLVRMLRLADANRLWGHARVDEVLSGLALALQAPVGGQAPLAVGRLNGSDFAVLFAQAQAPADLMGEMLARLRLCLADVSGAALTLSDVPWQRGDAVPVVLTRADAALARAEARGDFAAEQVLDQPAPALLEGGEDSWRRGIRAALDEARVKLVNFPVYDRGGALLHHECPLRLQLVAGGPFLAAAHWLPLALRTGQTPAVDELALLLALDAVRADGLPRCVNVAPQSLRSVAFVPTLREHLAVLPQLARLISIEVDESALVQDPSGVAELCRQLRPHGTRIGLEHAGDRLAAVGVLLDTGLDYVKLSGAMTRQVHGDTARLSLLRGAIQMLHGLGVTVIAEDVVHAQDLQAVWEAGADAATGPALGRD